MTSDCLSKAKIIKTFLVTKDVKFTVMAEAVMQQIIKCKLLQSEHYEELYSKTITQAD